MNNLQCRKAYVRVNLDVDEEGTIIPMLIRWKDGRVFQIEQLKYKCRASSNKVGGGGIRYTVTDVTARERSVEITLTPAASKTMRAHKAGQFVFLTATVNGTPKPIRSPSPHPRAPISSVS